MKDTSSETEHRKSWLLREGEQGCCITRHSASCLGTDAAPESSQPSAFRLRARPSTRWAACPSIVRGPATCPAPRLLEIRDDELFRKASQPFLAKGRWKCQRFPLLINGLWSGACDVCIWWWTEEREIPGGNFCLFSFLLLEHPWGLPFSRRSMVWRRKRATHSQGGYLQVLFSRDQCVESGEEWFQFCL